MTLIAAFRASNGGILLCSDRHEEDTVSKRSVDKIYQIRNPCLCLQLHSRPYRVNE
jgi:20S proteasome alpha/beta subunit